MDPTIVTAGSPAPRGPVGPPELEVPRAPSPSPIRSPGAFVSAPAGHAVPVAPWAPAARARRLAPPSWRDPRLLVGVALVLGSVVLGGRAVAEARGTEAVWALARPVGAGTALTAEDLRAVQVRLDPATADAYVAAEQRLAPGVVALRGLGTGELLPRAALGGGADVSGRVVALPLDAVPDEEVVEGGRVDVWVTWPADPAERGALPEPELLAEAADVAGVRPLTGGLGAARVAEVRVLLGPAVLPRALQALAVDAEVALVPVPGAAAAGAGR